MEGINFQINGLDIECPYVSAITPDGLEIFRARLPAQIHLWANEIATIGMELYWIGKGLRSPKASLEGRFEKLIPCVKKGRCRFFVSDGKMECLSEIGQMVVDKSCMTGDPNQPNLIRKMLDRRHVRLDLLSSDEYIVARGGYESHRFGVIGDSYSGFVEVDINKYLN